MSDSLTLRTMKTIDITIESGESLSDGVRLNGWKIARIQMPSTWTTAALTFQESYDGVDYRDIYDSSGEVSVPVAASRSITFQGGTSLPAVKYLKVRSGTSSLAVAQSAERVITLICVP